MIIDSASPVYIAGALPEQAGERLSVLTAATGEQLASWDREAGHGLFTHHLLDALYGAGDADADGRVTAREAKAYLDCHLTRAARRALNRRQNASFAGNADAVLASVGSGGAFPARPSLDEAAVASPSAPSPPSIERDKYLLGMEKAFESKDYARVLDFIGRLEGLGGALPAEVDFFRGEAEFHAGRFEARFARWSGTWRRRAETAPTTAARWSGC